MGWYAWKSEIVVWKGFSCGIHVQECVEAKERINGEDIRIFSLHHGFGYDYNSDDYKVLKVNHKTTTCISMIYTLRTDSWRRIQDYPRGAFPLETCATYVNGALHWLAKIRENDPFIIALDLTSETYMEAPVPDYGTGSSFAATYGFWETMKSY
ncbi:hypothetical protein ACLB2K_032192 [Fragaria x ananassa]